jgi:hypothetical protein
VHLPRRPPTPSSLRIGPTQETQEGTAAGIYGLIVSAAVMAASHAPSAVATILAVLATLIIYWAAERYARIVAERIHVGHPPTRQGLRSQLTTGWEMVTVSTLPLVVLVVTRLLGAALPTAVLTALVCNTLLLCVTGWRIGNNGSLTRWEQVASAAVAGLFGIGLIALKAMLH